MSTSHRAGAGSAAKNSPFEFSLGAGLALNPSLNLSLKTMQPSDQIRTKAFESETDIETEPAEDPIEPKKKQ